MKLQSCERVGRVVGEIRLLYRTENCPFISSELQNLSHNFVGLNRISSFSDFEAKKMIVKENIFILVYTIIYVNTYEKRKFKYLIVLRKKNM